MPRKKNKRSEPDRSHTLTLAELASHDDACSDALIDNAYYRAQIRKNRPKYNPLRGIREDEIPQILLHKVIVAKDVVAAEKALLQITGIKRYRDSLKSKAVQENFLRHLRKYIDMYRTDCPWEVSTTNRYTITTFEAAVTARARIKEHQTIPYLVGTLVPLTADESNQLDTTNRNFSIVCTGRKMNQSIFLGPARFANHDCDSNARLVPKGDNSMEVIALKSIEPGTEITVSYGDDYFGPGNMDCLCATCEKIPRNGWSPLGADGLPINRGTSRTSSRTATPDHTSKKRKRESESLTPASSSVQSLQVQRPAPSPSKLQQSWTPPATSESDATGVEETTTSAVAVEERKASPEETVLSPPVSLADFDRPESSSNNEDETSPAKRKRSPSEDSARKRQKIDPTQVLLGDPELLQPALPSPTSQEENVVEEDGDDEQQELDPDTIRVKLETTEVVKIENDVPSSGKKSSRKGLQPLSRFQYGGLSSGASAITTVTTTELSKSVATLNSTKAGSNTVMPSIESNSMQVSSNTTITIQPLSATHRTPGDWYLTRKLLAQPHDRWVQCHNERCLDYFLQANGYQTRRECPRCERHSMLYGFPWPKTDPNHRKILERPGTFKEKRDPKLYSAYRRQGKQGKGTWVEGGGDEEERTMDHRTIHRFVLPEDEKAVARRSLLKQAEVERLKGENAFMAHFGREGNKRVLDSEIVERDSITPDGELRRRSHRIVQARVYADV